MSDSEFPDIEKLQKQTFQKYNQDGITELLFGVVLYMLALAYQNVAFIGVSASFASVGDINIAEPKALIGFAGRRVIEQTVREKLPEDFQTAEFLLNHGQLDAIIHRKEMREKVASIVHLHTTKEGAKW